MKKRSAIITAFDPYSIRGGIETYTLQLISLLESREIEVTVYHTGLLRNDVAVKNINLHNKLFEKIYLIGRKLLDDDKEFDFIISNSYYGMGYFPPRVRTFIIHHSSYSGFFIKQKEKIAHNPYFPYSFLLEEMAEYISGFNSVNIAVSDEVKKELEAVHGFTNVKVVPNGIDTNLFKKMDKRVIREKLGIPGDSFVGIFVGRWDNKQKRKIIIEHVISERPDILWFLVLCPGGEECEIKNRHNVVINQNVAHEEIPLLYNTADFMLFPSAYEGFGMVITEAMACGVPVITTNVGIVPSVYRDEPFNLLLLPDDANIASINEKINLLKEDHILRQKIGDEGIDIVREKFSIEQWRKGMGEVIGIGF